MLQAVTNLAQQKTRRESKSGRNFYVTCARPVLLVLFSIFHRVKTLERRKERRCVGGAVTADHLRVTSAHANDDHLVCVWTQTDDKQGK